MTANAFNRLDTQVKKVVARVRELEKDNEKLRLKSAKLENTIRKTPEPAWEEEKAAVRARMESLAEHLEGVLEG